MLRELHCDCPGCGSSMRFAAGADALECDHCGHRLAIERDGADELQLFDFEAALRQPERLRPFAAVFPDGHEVECDRCGGRTVLEGQAGHCPYCGGPVLHDVTSEDLVSPDSILPFSITQEAVVYALAFEGC